MNHRKMKIAWKLGTRSSGYRPSESRQPKHRQIQHVENMSLCHVLRASSFEQVRPPFRSTNSIFTFSKWGIISIIVCRSFSELIYIPLTRYWHVGGPPILGEIRSSPNDAPWGLSRFGKVAQTLPPDKGIGIIFESALTVSKPYRAHEYFTETQHR